MSSAVSAGILLFRRRSETLEVLLAHPGGPFWSGRDSGVWTLPKGLAEAGESLEAVALREFGEETGSEVGAVAAEPSRAPIPLGAVELKSGKAVHGWAIEGDLEPALARSNEFELEWPPRSGRRALVPEVDRVAWFGPTEARLKIHPAQVAFIDRLEAVLAAALDW